MRAVIVAQNFAVEFKAIAGETYYLQAAMYDDKVGEFSVIVTMDSAEDDDPFWWGGDQWGPYPIDAGDTMDVEIYTERDYYSYYFVPETSGTYIFKSTGSLDTMARILDEDEDLLYDNDEGYDDYSNHNFLIKFEAKAGELYYLETCLYEYETGEYSVTLTKSEPKSIANATVTNVVTKTYTGKAITQAPVVKLNGVTLRKDVDYTLAYSNNVRPGLAALVIITGKGNYTGTTYKQFTIRPVVPAVKLSKLKKGSKSFTAQWTKASAAVQKQFTGYQIQYSTSKSFLSSKTKNTTQKSAKKVIIRKLKKKKTYYVRIRRYYRWNGQLLYSAWSPVKIVKTK